MLLRSNKEGGLIYIYTRTYSSTTLNKVTDSSNNLCFPGNMHLYYVAKN